tara:strand:+ start:1114 stop:3501 length:2388 start_codon:yes stop_codon:yes gene_type:complete
MADDNKNEAGLAGTEKEAVRLADALGQSEERLKQINAIATEAKDSFSSMVEKISQSARSSGDFTNSLKNSASLVKGMQNDAKLLAGFNKDNLKTEKDHAKLEKRKAAFKNKIVELDSQIKFLAEARVNAAEDERQAINNTLKELTEAKSKAQELAESFQEIAEANTKINKESQFFDNMSDFTSQIPGMSKMFGEFGNAAKAAREAASEGGNAFAAGAKQMTGAFGKLAMGFFVGTFIKGLFEGDQRVTDLSRNLNISRGRAAALNNEFNAIGASTAGLVGEDIMKATTSVADALGISAKLSRQTAIGFATATEKLGLSVLEATALNNISAATGTNLQDFNNSLIGRVKLQNDAQGQAIRYQDVMKDIAGTSAATQMTTSKFPGGLAKAAYEARKLGLNFDTLNNSAGGLLDFENSIAAEMEAELLLGRDLNLDKARAAALSGDQATLAAELAKNLGSAAEFSDLSVLQQESLAKALGMSREEVAQTFINQKAMAAFSDVEGATLDEKVRAEFKRVDGMAEGVEKQKEMAKLQEKTGNSEQLRQLKNQSAAEAQAEAMKQMAESVQKLSGLLEPITAFFQKISSATAEIFGFIGKMGSKFMAIGKVLGEFLVKPIGKAFKSFKGFGKFLGGGIFKSAGKVGIKSLLKKIPILGALIGMGLAYKRYKEGDWLGAGGELLSGLVSIFPGIGTVASVAIDGALAARDMGYIGDRQGTLDDAKANKDTAADFISRPGQPIQKFRADDIIMGGTKLTGGNDNTQVTSLLKELLTAVQAGGDVIMDGNKVGSTLALGVKLSN